MFGRSYHDNSITTVTRTDSRRDSDKSSNDAALSPSNSSINSSVSIFSHPKILPVWTSVHYSTDVALNKDVETEYYHFYFVLLSIFWCRCFVFRRHVSKTWFFEQQFIIWLSILNSSILIFLHISIRDVNVWVNLKFYSTQIAPLSLLLQIISHVRSVKCPLVSKPYSPSVCKLRPSWGNVH